ncbi:MAG: iron ABC transporter permease [Coriobacteriales bacterium]|jgi:iron complex transport system permease protein|nr:iron ABC transporter permease [Coriobacteriales bacterium]
MPQAERATGQRQAKSAVRLGGYGLLALALLALAVATVSLAVGRFSIDVPLLLSTLVQSPSAIGHLIRGEALGNEELVVFKMRLPRILAALIIGGAMGMAGAAFQGMFRNPMVSPDLLGATWGAGFGAACAMLFSLPMAVITGSAFLGGLVAVLLTYIFSSTLGRGSANITTLVLTGVVISALFQALISITKYVADPYSQLPGITFFLMGGLSGITWNDIAFILAPVLAGSVVLYSLRWRINILSLDDDESRSLGMDTQKVRILVIVCATLISAVCVAVSGMIGWVGLVIPHLMRMVFGPDYRRLLPASFLAGALYLVLMDDIARGMFSMEIPIGILTALVGAPVFLFLLFRYKGGWR